MFIVSCTQNDTKDTMQDDHATEEKQVDRIQQKIDTILNKMTVEEKVGQLIFATPKVPENIPVGGIILFDTNIETKKQTIEMIEKYQETAKIPMFIGVDEEGGDVARVSSNAEMDVTHFPPMEEIGETGDPSNAYEVGSVLGRELKTLGFNVDFAPVADVLMDSDTKEIGDRSFGSDPELVSQMVEQNVKGLQENGVSAAVKHFPGHGSAQADSHEEDATSNRTLEDLRKDEFLPFKAGIDAGCDFVLMSHMTLPKVDASGVPSSLSKVIVTDLLRGELGFEGIAITDSLVMGAVTSKYGPSEAAMMAIQAGEDMLLIPSDIEWVHERLYRAVEDGEISEERIDESVTRILRVKIKNGLINL